MGLIEEDKIIQNMYSCHWSCW